MYQSFWKKIANVKLFQLYSPFNILPVDILACIKAIIKETSMDVMRPFE